MILHQLLSYKHVHRMDQIFYTWNELFSFVHEYHGCSEKAADDYDTLRWAIFEQKSANFTPRIKGRVCATELEMLLETTSVSDDKKNKLMLALYKVFTDTEPTVILDKVSQQQIGYDFKLDAAAIDRIVQNKVAIGVAYKKLLELTGQIPNSLYPTVQGLEALNRTIKDYKSIDGCSEGTWDISDVASSLTQLKSIRYKVRCLSEIVEVYTALLEKL